ncbi:hypothetical protein AYM40_02175 [Paraburkholderia phytofirmans OLGA172]|uniref:Uncharacterized protein n=1 Tax=Paraburkholderia phytofirmans OLGA172 TaxID=1417228 RepID=A0A160FH06_9BURK|nr:hypothetical protein AYM40_02175 [Paraburkholderia phytofirmans OLGA172]
MDALAVGLVAAGHGSLMALVQQFVHRLANQPRDAHVLAQSDHLQRLDLMPGQRDSHARDFRGDRTIHG